MFMLKNLIKNLKGSQLVEKILIAAFSISAGAAVTVYGVSVIQNSKSAQIDEDDVSGKTYNYNQTARNGNFADTSNIQSAGGNLSVENGVLSYQITNYGTHSEGAHNYIQPGVSPGLKAEHKYLVSFDVFAPKTLQLWTWDTWRVSLGTANANSWTPIKIILDERANMGWINQIRMLLFEGQTDYVVGDVIQFKNYMVIDLTEWYGSGSEPSSASEFVAKFPNEYYPFQSTPLELTKSQINNL